MKKYLNWLILFGLLYLFLEGSAFIALLLLEKIRGTAYYPADTLSVHHRSILQKLLNGESKYIIYSPVLGWTTKPNGATDLYHANSQGMRNSKEYALIPPENVVRIAAFGDSYTHGDDVNNPETWQEYMNTAQTALEVLNFGVRGYGLDQAFLRYEQDGVLYHPHIVFLGFMSENMFRNVNVFRPFYSEYTGLPLSKPRFLVSEGKLALFPNPLAQLSDYADLLARPTEILPQIGAHDYFYQAHYRYTRGAYDLLPSIRLIKMATTKFWRESRLNILRNGYYNEESEAFRVTCKIFEEFQKMTQNQHSLPVILIFPHKDDVRRYRTQGTKVYTPLLRYFDAQGYQYIDLLEAFSQAGNVADIDALFGNWHYSPRGNEVVAKYLSDYLQQHNLMKLAKGLEIHDHET